MNPIDTILSSNGYIMLDGALATELESRGCDIDHDLWSAKILADNPQAIEQLNRDYLDAGADVIATASYQASVAGFVSAGFSQQQAVALLQRSVEISCSARDAFWSKAPAGRCKPLVAASMGPYGAYLADGSEYNGEYGVSRSELYGFHKERVNILAQTNADLLAFETVPSLQEAEIILEVLEFRSEISAWMSFSCRDETSISHGESFADVVALCNQSDKLVACGINCTAPEFVEGLLSSAAGSRLPLMVYPNSGEHWNAQEHAWAGSSCSGFPVAQWYDAGARIFGGCCRTTVNDIQEIRRELDHHISKRKSSSI